MPERIKVEESRGKTEKLVQIVAVAKLGKV